MAVTSAIDPTTGDLTVDGLSLVIGRSLTLTAFRARPDAARFDRVDGPTPWPRLAATIAGDAFLVILEFDHERLATVRLVANDPAIGGKSWDDYDPETVRRFHDVWLETQLGRRGEPWQEGSYPLGGVEYRYEWGTVGSFLHPQDMSASITIRYA